jgi:cytidyltransferase-like protein
MDKKQIVYIPGVFDLIHAGHLNVLKRAKLCGDYLIVGVCSDRLTEKHKGRVVVKQAWRAEMLEALTIVDEVFIYDNLDQSYAIEMFMVNTFAVGEEFGSTPEHQNALKYCKDNNVNIVKIKRFPGISSTELKKKVKEIYT